MTAPLPPLPLPVMFSDLFRTFTVNGEDAFTKSHLEAYAKLAVREALQRLLDQKTYEFTPSHIRAMLEDYK